MIWLSGELGAGKTTFVQGLGLGLGLGEEVSVTSPTYALENRYEEKLLHMDLYRLESPEAKKLVEESEGFPGVRVIEWSERTGLGLGFGLGPNIGVTFGENSETDRSITITFNDLNWPDRKTIEEWRTEVKLPDHIGVHCDAVGALCKKCAESLLSKGVICRPEAVRVAGELHDLLRFVDFKPGMNAKIPHAKEADKETQAHWDALKAQYAEVHEWACAEFLEERGFPELATIIRPHGLRSIDHPEEYTTIEQKVLYYADKRIQYNKVVSLDERFDDFVRRYDNGEESENAKRWRSATKEMEAELFGDDIP